MTDRIILPGNGKPVAFDLISDVNFQRFKLIHGADGVNDGDVSLVNGLPVVDVARIDTPETFIDTSFVVGDSPVTLDCNAALGRNATEFLVFNDGGGDFTVSISNDGAAFGDEHTVKNGETYGFLNISVDSIRITHVADSAYRVVVL